MSRGFLIVSCTNLCCQPFAKVLLCFDKAIQKQETHGIIFPHIYKQAKRLQFEIGSHRSGGLLDMAGHLQAVVAA